MENSRRGFLVLAGLAPLVALSGTRSRAADAVCYDPASLSSSDASLRQSLGFMLVSKDPKRHCGLCAFFAATQGGCGTCQLLSGGPTTANSVCNSFAAKT